MSGKTVSFKVSPRIDGLEELERKLEKIQEGLADLAVAVKDADATMLTVTASVEPWEPTS